MYVIILSDCFNKESLDSNSTLALIVIKKDVVGLCVKGWVDFIRW